MAEPEPHSEHWLYRLSPERWVGAAIAELGRARVAVEQRNRAAAVVAVKRAAGMALNGALCVRPRPEWGRTYVEHLAGLMQDESAPAEVRRAAQRLYDEKPPEGPIVVLHTRRADAELLDAAEVVMAHAYALVFGSAGRGR
jgi:HEPN domain-containing protein